MRGRDVLRRLVAESLPNIRPRSRDQFERHPGLTGFIFSDLESVSTMSVLKFVRLIERVSARVRIASQNDTAATGVWYSRKYVLYGRGHPRRV